MFRRNFKYSWIILVILLALISPLQAQEIKYGKCLYVVDGDTVDVDFNGNGRIEKHSERVRVLGIDCFETRWGKRLERQAERAGISVEKARELGLKAKEYGKNVLLGKEVKVEVYGRGGYGRILGYVYVDGKDYGAELLKMGLAKVYRKNKKHPKYREYLGLEHLN